METVTVPRNELIFTLARMREVLSLLKFSGATKSEQFQDLYVLSELSFKRGGFFCEFGAFDGITASNTFVLEKLFDWQGIIAEPNPDQYKNIIQNRNCHISDRAVLAVSDIEVEFIISSNPSLSGAAEFFVEDGHTQARTKDFRTVTVNSISLMDLLDKYNAPKQIDYISIDTEGSELEILKAFDFNKYKVKVFTVEHNNTTNKQDIAEIMQRNGYEIKYPILSGGEYFFTLIVK
jgi:FkbM family methyltransferase